jgi:PTS system sucrose-specific IIC component
MGKTIAGSIAEEEFYEKDEKKEGETFAQKMSRTFGDIFMPVVPVLVATGLFIGVDNLAAKLGIEFSETARLLMNMFTTTAFAFVPALVTWSAMKKFGGTPAVGIVLGLLMVAPQLPNGYAVAAGSENPAVLSALGYTVAIAGCQGSVLPALVLGIIAAKLERLLKKIVPSVIDLIATPFLTVLIGTILGCFFIVPLMDFIEQAAFSGVKAFLELPYGMGGFVIGGLHQTFVATGISSAFYALDIELLSMYGRDIFNATITGSVVAQGGAALAVALGTKDAKKRALYISAAITTVFGMSEPAIFGVNLRQVKPYIYGLAGGAAAGMTARLMDLAGTGMGITALPGVLLYVDNILGYFIVNITGFSVAFFLTYILYKPQE